MTPAIGPSNGMSETLSASEEPNIAAISDEQSWSTLITKQILEHHYGSHLQIMDESDGQLND